jgi:peptide/nickel transport system substrate-binding protein
VWVVNDATTGERLSQIFEPLNRRNPVSLRFEPRLADLPKISGDGLTYTYTLREGLTWSDGEPLTADDVLFTLDVIFDPRIETWAREGMMVDVIGADGSIKREPFKYRKVDERTVEFTLPQRYAPAESIFSFPVAPRHKLEGPYKAGTFNSAWNTTTPVSELASSGPFVITEHVPGQRFVFRRNPRFWGRSKDGTRQPLPYLDRIVFPIVSDLNAQALKFRAGQTDAMDVPAAEYAAVKRGEAGGDYRVYARGLSWSWLYLGLNQNREARLDPRLLALFNDVRFRRAVAHACDRERLCRDVFAGLARPVYGPVTPANTLYHNPRVPRYEYDPSRSRALLREIGLKDADGDGIVEANGANVRFNLLTSASNPANIAVATILSEDLKKIGLGVRFTAIDFNELLRRTNTPPFEWEAVLLGLGGSPEPNDVSAMWRSSGRFHKWWPQQKRPATPWEAEIDTLFARGARELDPARRKQIYDRWQQIAAEQQPLIFLTAAEQVSAVRTRFRNIKPASLAGITWNAEEIFDAAATRRAP